MSNENRIKLVTSAAGAYFTMLHINPWIYDIASKVYHHQNTRRKEQLNCHLDLVVFDDSIAVTTKDK